MKTTTTGLIILLLCLIPFGSIYAQKLYEIDVTGAHPDIRKGHLDLGGNSITGEAIEVNNFYIERNKKAFIPVVGEFHYCRYPNQYWDEEIKKIKAGGVNTIATYVFWNIHERKEGSFHWDDDLNLRHFVELCKSNGLEVIVRIGPFAHGEIRNGGIPDWLYGCPFEIRSNDSLYLEYVRKFYHEIGRQLEGLYFKDGGPVIGIQLENEYQHSAAPWAITYEGAEREYTSAQLDRKIIQGGVGVNTSGNDLASYGHKHMQLLKEMAKEEGMIVPIYTATGWGYASIVNNGSIPVMAGYAYPFWEAGNKPSNFYLYKNLHKQPDYSPVSYIPEDYPSIAAELGTGMAVTYSRRPQVKGESFLPMMVRVTGSGANGLGYYMYHGGTTPSEGFFMFSEGSGLNLKSYDYQAPVHEFGNPGEGYYGLKVINHFLNCYGDVLAPLYPVIPQGNDKIRPEDTVNLRYCVRTDGTKGFLFMHNFQDHIQTKDLNNLQVSISSTGGKIQFPEIGTFTLKSGASAIFPFHMRFGPAEMLYAMAQPLCSFRNNGTQYYVFFSVEGIMPEIKLKGLPMVKTKNAIVIKRNGNTFIKGPDDGVFEFTMENAYYLVMPFEEAKHTYLAGSRENQYIVISSALVLGKANDIEVISEGKDTWNMEFYPRIKSIQSHQDEKISTGESDGGLLTHATVQLKTVKPNMDIVRYDDRHYVLRAPQMDLSQINDVYIKFDYTGDRAVCMLKGELVTDNLYNGIPWQIGLKRFAEVLKSEEMYFYFLPMKKNAPYLSYLDAKGLPDFTKTESYLLVNPPEIIPEYKIELRINKGDD